MVTVPVSASCANATEPMIVSMEPAKNVCISFIEISGFLHSWG
jgi:hypothetical protein